MRLLLVWLQALSAVSLFGLAVYLWIVVRADWLLARYSRDVRPAMIAQARGFMRMAWLRLVEAILIGLLSARLVAIGTDWASRSGVRVMFLIITVLQLAGIITEHLTRLEVGALVKSDRRSRELTGQDPRQAAP